MRISALMGLMILSVMAGCGDDDKGDDKDKDDGANNGSNSSEDEQFDAGMLPGIDDDNLDDCDKGDPCCINSDEFDFTRCMGMPDAGPTEE